MNIKYSDARELLDQGFSIFPVNITWDETKKKFDKKPAVAWKEYQDKLPTDEELHKWFDSEQYNGIGLATGRVSGVVVVDVEKDGLNQVTLESKRISNTISGGKHYYYKAPDEKIGNTVRIGGKQMDFRGDGGFVVVPPSNCNESGYTWECECPEFMLNDLPEITDWIEVKEPSKLSEMTNKGEGERNDSLYRTACSALSRSNEEEAWSFVQSINKTFNPPLTDYEVKTVFNSAYKFVKGQQTEKNHIEDSIVIGQPVAWSKIKEDGNTKDWVWENYIAKKHTTLLSALWKAGKTTFLRCLFVAMAHNEEFAGQPTKKTKVLIISEEAEGEWVDNRADIENLTDVDDILVWSRPIRGKPNLKQWTTFIQETSDLCTREKIDMVVIDTLTTFWPIDNENDSAQVIKALIPLYYLTEDAKVAVLLVHHFRKGGGEEAQASRGSGALPGFVDNIIEFTRSDSGFPNQRTLKTYGRFNEVIPEVVIEYGTDGRYITKGEPWQVSKSARLNKILSVVDNASEPVCTKEIFNTLNRENIAISLRGVQRYVSELLLRNELTTTVEKVVGNKTTPFYARTGWQMSLGQRTDDNPSPLPLRPVVSSVEKNIVVSLSSVDKKQPPTDDTTGTSVNRKNSVASNFLPYKDADSDIPF